MRRVLKNCFWCVRSETFALWTLLRENVRWLYTTTIHYTSDNVQILPCTSVSEGAARLLLL